MAADHRSERSAGNNGARAPEAGANTDTNAISVTRARAAEAPARNERVRGARTQEATATPSNGAQAASENELRASERTRRGISPRRRREELPEPQAKGSRAAEARSAAVRDQAAREEGEGRTAAREPRARAAESPEARAAESPEAQAPAKRRRALDVQTIPEGVKKRFVQVERDYFFADGARAFTDQGRTLTTPSENTEVVRSLVEIAQARGWQEITVSGTERFRKEAWTAAKLAGLTVSGYTPSDFERQRLVQQLARGAVRPMPGAPAAEARASPRAGPEAPRARGSPDAEPRAAGAQRARPAALLTGVLIDHGAAPYRHDRHEPMSYFVRLKTARGEREIWGVDLERAFKESLTRPRPGDTVGLRTVSHEAVTVKARERDASGAVIGEKKVPALRSRWIVEKRDFLEARAQVARTVRDAAVDAVSAVREHPELAGTYATLRAAEITAKQFRDTSERQRFVATVRASLADAIARGEPLEPVRLREPQATRERPVAAARENAGAVLGAPQASSPERRAPAREVAPVR